MGQGIDLAAVDNPVHAAAIANMKDQLLIVLLNRLGGSIAIPVSEIDDTGQDCLMFHVEGTTFHFTVAKKS